MKREVLIGSITGVVALFPAAFLLALFYRFPLPMAGYESGLSAALKALIAVIFYGLFGAFPAAIGLGALGGLAAGKIAAGQPLQEKLIYVFGFIGGFVVALTLSVLDKIIGPW